MLRLFYLLVFLIGAGLAGVSLALLVATSPIGGQDANLDAVFLWSITLLVGVLISGWSVRRLLSPDGVTM